MKKVLMATLFASACGLASAQGYAGALIGLSKIATDCPPGVSCDDSDTGYKVFGGYEVAPNISVELGYTDFGKSSAENGTDRDEIEAQAFSVVGAFRANFTPEWTGVARLGLASVKAKRSTTGFATQSDSSIKLYTGLGVEYAVSKDFKLTGAFDFTTAEVEGDSGTVYVVGVGAQMGF